MLRPYKVSASAERLLGVAGPLTPSEAARDRGQMSRSPMVVRTVPALRRAVEALRTRKAAVALVPTMGALHDGHVSLVRLARRRAQKVVVSIFVNPTQFAPPEGFATRIVPEGPATAGLEDRFRPHFFGGVATVVGKLFTQVRPDVAIFGE